MAIKKANRGGGAIQPAGHKGKPEPQRMKPPVILPRPPFPPQPSMHTLGVGSTKAPAPAKGRGARGQDRAR